MIDKICTFLTNRIRKENPNIDDERAEVINYGLQNIIGEFPKIILVFIIAYILGIFKWTLFTFIILFVYKGASGGIHLKTHIGCILFTTAFYCQKYNNFICMDIWNGDDKIICTCRY